MLWLWRWNENERRWFPWMDSSVRYWLWWTNTTVWKPSVWSTKSLWRHMYTKVSHVCGQQMHCAYAAAHSDFFSTNPIRASGFEKSIKESMRENRRSGKGKVLAKMPEKHTSHSSDAHSARTITSIPWEATIDNTKGRIDYEKDYHWCLDARDVAGDGCICERGDQVLQLYCAVRGDFRLPALPSIMRVCISPKAMATARLMSRMKFRVLTRSKRIALLSIGRRKAKRSAHLGSRLMETTMRINPA